MIQFKVNDSKVAVISNSGELEAREIGIALITGMAVGLDSDAGLIIYSSDQITVTVTELENIRISTPLKRLLVNTKVFSIPVTFLFSASSCLSS